MKILKESVLPTEIEDVLSTSKELLSLGSNLGFRQISGIDVITNIQAALRAIEDLKSQEYGEASDDDIVTYKEQQKRYIDSYLEKARQAIVTLNDQSDKLKEGTRLAKKVVDELFAINNKL